MAPDKRDFGFWRNVGHTSVGQLVGLEGLISVPVGAAGAIWLVTVSDLEGRLDVAGDFLELGAALVGVVFAGFALVIALLSDRYLLLLERSPNGLRGFLSPFMINIGVLVFLVILTVVYRASAKSVPEGVENISFCVLCVIFLYSALNIVALARNVLAHGSTRAELAKIDELERAALEVKRRRDGGD